MAERLDKGKSGLFAGIANELKERLQRLQSELNETGN